MKCQGETKPESRLITYTIAYCGIQMVMKSNVSHLVYSIFSILSKIFKKDNKLCDIKVEYTKEENHKINLVPIWSK